MKTSIILFFTLFLIYSISFAQDTLYIYSDGSVVGKRAIAKIDSIIFYNPTYTQQTSNLTVLNFSPTFKVELKPVGCWEMKGLDSVDINNDNIYDFVIEIGYLNDKPYEECCPAPDPLDSITNYDCWPQFFQYYNIRPTNNIEILASDSINFGYIPNSQSYSCFIDTLTLEDSATFLTRLKTKDKWRNNKNLFLYNHNMPPTDCNNKWDNPLYKDKYIGFRIKVNTEYKYGWIKVGLDTIHTFKEIVYEK